MSNETKGLNGIINFNDKTDDLLEQKIMENEANIEALEHLNSLEDNKNELKEEENEKEEVNHSNKEQDDSSIKQENKENKNEINHNEQNDTNITNPDVITPQKNKASNTNVNNSNSMNTNNNSSNLNINISINNDNKKPSNNNITNYKNDKANNGNNGKDKDKDSYYLPYSERKRNKKGTGSNITQNTLKSRIDNKVLYDSNIDQSLLYQYLNLFSNQNIKNHSAQKRKINKPRINNNNKSQNRNKNSSTNKDNNDKKFTCIYNRFIEDQKKKKEKLEKMKQNLAEEENKIYYYKPKINKKSLELTSKNKEGFYARQKKLMEEQKKKDALLIEKVHKEERDEINKNNILLSHIMSTKDGNKKNGDKNRKRSVDETINKLYEWDIKRKEKIIKEIKKKEKEKTKDIHLQKKPKINKNSIKIVENKNQKELINRLYKDDVVKRREKKEYLSQLYTPTFHPIVSKKKNIRVSPIKKRNKNNRNDYHTQNENQVTNDNFLNENEHYLTTNLLEKMYDEEDDNYKYAININELIRERVFSKVKNKPRFNSTMRFNVNRTSSMNDYNRNGSSFKIHNKNGSTSYIKKNKKRIKL